MLDKERVIKTISVPIEATIRQTMNAIDNGAVGFALLVEPETHILKGLVTDGDIRRALLNGYGLESSAASIPRPKTRTEHVKTPLEIITTLHHDVRVIPLLNDEEQVVDLVIFDRRLNLPVAEPKLGEKELNYISECVLTGWISSSGKFVNRFEEMFASFCGTNNAIATSNGTAALHLALLALGIGQGDEVIIPTLTFIATANAVAYTGAKPVFVDSEMETWNIDPALIENAITAKTKAIIPVHLYGHPANMGPLLRIAKKHGLAVLEDAAEAHGSAYKGKPVGSMGDIGTFSFYGNKIITTGEGGMVVTNRPDLADKIKLLRDHGMSSKHRYWHTVLGYNYRMTNLQAAIGVAQMEKVELILSKKRNIFQAYSGALKDVAGLILPKEAPWAKSICWLYTILIDDSFGLGRDELMHRLKARGIDTRPVFPPLHTQPIYNTGKKFPVAEKISARGLSFPSAVSISLDDVKRVADNIGSIRSEVRV